AVNTVWWFGKTRSPKANVSKVLVEYSDRMKKLLEYPEGFYTPKKRPSGHDIGKAFGKDNGGAIPPNLLQISNSESNGSYLRGCKTVCVKGHPARFPAKLPEFFIRFLTEPGDLVLDIFAGSNTTGWVAECEGRKWLAFEERLDYLAASSFRFFADATTDAELKAAHAAILHGEIVDLRSDVFQMSQTSPRNGNLHRPAMPSQGVLVLAETTTASKVKNTHSSSPVSYKRRGRSKH
ncbi:MAG TPA: site-specific DNA-methyltransferase, partial [Verrucomicrobiae bacterium]